MPRGSTHEIERAKQRVVRRRGALKVGALVLLSGIVAFSIGDHLGWFSYPGNDWALAGREARVLRVASGDSLELQGCGEVKLLGVGWDRRGEGYLERITGRMVTIRFDTAGTRDKRGRMEAYLYVDGRCLNQNMIEQGVAYADGSVGHGLLGSFRLAEGEARRKRVGRWK